MLTVLLIILKIIGIILLCIIGLILLILLLILFVPVRYNMSAVKKDGFTGRLKVSYLLHILHISAEYTHKDIKYCVRLFGFPIKRSYKEKDKDKDDTLTFETTENIFKDEETEELNYISYSQLTVNNINNNSNNNSNNNNNNNSNNSNINNSNIDNSNNNNCNNYNITSNNTSKENNLWEALDALEENGDIESLEFNIHQPTHIFEYPKEKNYSDPAFDEFKETDQTDRFYDDQKKHSSTNNGFDGQKIIEAASNFIKDNILKAKAFLKKVYKFVRGLVNRSEEKLKKLEKKVKKFQYYEDFLTSYEFQSALRLSMRNILKMVKRILPKKVFLDVDFGMESPDQTGYIMALLSIMSGKIKGTYLLRPDFENKVFNGIIRLKGRVILIELLCPAIKVILNKNVQTVYKQYKGKDKNPKSSKEEK